MNIVRLNSNLQKIRKAVTIDDRIRVNEEGVEGDSIYDLQGLVVHKGKDMASGHYIAAIKKDECSWYEADDSVATLYPKQLLLDQCKKKLLYPLLRKTS